MTSRRTAERRASAARERPAATGGERSLRAALALLGAAAFLAAGGCAAAGGDPEPGTVEAARATADSAAAAREEETAARRAASDRLVERGRRLLEQERAREAAGVLERAVRRDPSNGHAYLALARARVRLGEAGSAVGLLERASALLREDEPGAAARADSLRAALEASGGRSR